MIKNVLEMTYQATDTADPEVNQANLTRNLTFISHQMVVIMKSLNLPFCSCGSCTDHLGYEQANTSASEIKPVNVNSFDDEEEHESAIQTAVSYEESGTEATTERETLDRRHKHYGSRKEREEIARCGRLYGTRAASKKYNIPVYSVRYYMKTMAKSLKSARLQLRPKLLRRFPAPIENGRGRGRPCLLGKGLETLLLEHLMDVKNSSPDENLSVSQTLKIAKEFLQANSPEVLAENGGAVRMSSGWGMRLLKRLPVKEQELLTETKNAVPSFGQTGCRSSSRLMADVDATSELVDADNQGDGSNFSRIAGLTPLHEDKKMLLSASMIKKRTRRGRPSLLGEDVDKKLCNHLIQLEHTSSGVLSSGSKILQHAHDFLRQHAPELLPENGGTLRLSYAWATGMRKRIIARSNGVEMVDTEAFSSGRSRSGSHVSERASPAAEKDCTDADLYRDIPPFICDVKTEPTSHFS